MTNLAIITAADLFVVARNDEPRVHDLRLAEALGFAHPRQIRELISRNREELERYGPASCHTTVVDRPQGGGSTATEYWLTEGQALLVCIKSETARAPDVREELIKVFMAWRHGHLVPATLDAIGELFDAKLVPVHVKIDNVESNVRYLTNDMRYVTKRLDDIVPRREFSAEVKQQWLHVIAKRYSGDCPCCREAKIADANGEPTSALQFDHFRGRERRGKDDGWPVCMKCNHRLREAPFKEKCRHHFEVFHDYRRALFAGHPPSGPKKNEKQGDLFK